MVDELLKMLAQNEAIRYNNYSRSKGIEYIVQLSKLEQSGFPCAPFNFSATMIIGTNEIMPMLIYSICIK